ncbi:hypothetical protein PM082_007867 [Marasmius tenuissimus]|nr:hypothetical protein PM082_007867 [Marasmius tenuissimus]
MAVVFQVPEELALVGASLLSTTILLFYQTTIVFKARTAAGIEYPQVYAEKAQEDASIAAKKFNCAQRAHQNTLEGLFPIYVKTAITAVRYPKLAAGMLAAWTVARVIFTHGYATGDPKKRTFGALLGDIPLVGLLGTSLYVVGTSLQTYFF